MTWMCTLESSGVDNSRLFLEGWGEEPAEEVYEPRIDKGVFTGVKGIFYVRRYAASLGCHGSSQSYKLSLSLQV